MPLPTANLTAHFDASDTDNVFTTFDGVGGNHSGVPADGNAVAVWAPEGDGSVTDLILLRYPTAGDEPAYRSATPLMAHSCLDFDGTLAGYRAENDTGGTAKAISNFIAASACTVLVAIYPEAIESTAANIYDADGVVADSSGYWGIHLRNDSGTRRAYFYNYDSNVDTVYVPVSVGASCVLMARHESGNIYLSKDGGTEVQAASGDTGSLAGAFLAGRGGTAKFNGRIGELAIWNAALTGSALTDAINYFMAKWLGVGGGSIVNREAMRRGIARGIARGV